MVTSVPMPKLGAGVYHEGTILRWMKAEGDHVEAEEPIAEIETDKAVSEYQSPASGTVLKLLYGEGETVEVGKPILLLGEPGEHVPPDYVSASREAPGERAPVAKPPDVSPAARRLAENLKVEISTVTGTGPGGSILREDILRAARVGKSQHVAAEAPQGSSSKVIPLTAMRMAIAERMVKSQKETAHVTLTREVEVSSLSALVKGEGERLGLGFNDLIIKAVAMALKLHPMMNSQLEGKNVRLSDSINIGFAVAVEGGLITPTVRDADRLDTKQVAEAVKALSEKARNRQLSPEEYTGATFTVSNLGAYGIEGFTPIINPPQVGILGVGRVMERPWVDGGTVKAMPTVHLSLTFDHRVVDGADAALFLDAVVRLLRDLSWVRS